MNPQLRKLALDLGPLLIFFAAFKFLGIFAATAAFTISTTSAFTISTTSAFAGAAVTVATIAHTRISSASPSGFAPSGLSSRRALLDDTSNWSTLTVM